MTFPSLSSFFLNIPRTHPVDYFATLHAHVTPPPRASFSTHRSSLSLIIPMSAPAEAPVTLSNDKEQADLQELINAKLVQSGERERLKQLLRERLVECGWRDELKEQCKRIVKERGFETITTEELAKEITPVGRSTVPVRRKKMSIAPLHSLGSILFSLHLNSFLSPPPSLESS